MRSMHILQFEEKDRKLIAFCVFCLKGQRRTEQLGGKWKKSWKLKRTHFGNHSMLFVYFLQSFGILFFLWYQMWVLGRREKEGIFLFYIIEWKGAWILFGINVPEKSGHSKEKEEERDDDDAYIFTSLVFSR